MQILRNSSVGLILRAFAKDEKFVERQARHVIETCQRALAMRIEGTLLFNNNIDVLVPRDERYLEVDCGLMAEYLAKRLPSQVSVTEVEHGDVSAEVTQRGIVRQALRGVDYSFILSAEVRDYFDVSTVSAMLEAIDKGALVSGVAIEELTESVLKGRIANTFAVWENARLLEVGGFDLRVARPRRDDRLARYMRGWDPETGEEVFYPLGGVEEIIPCIRLIERYGSCIAPILPQGAGRTWQTPDPQTDPEGYARHRKKLGTKWERQAVVAAMEGVDLSFLEGGILPGYRM